MFVQTGLFDKFILKTDILLVYFCRVLLDRAVTPWDDTLHQMDMTSGSFSGIVGDYVTYIREKKM